MLNILKKLYCEWNIYLIEEVIDSWNSSVLQTFERKCIYILTGSKPSPSWFDFRRLTCERRYRGLEKRKIGKFDNGDGGETIGCQSRFDFPSTNICNWVPGHISALFLSRVSTREPLVSKCSFADHVKITCPLVEPRNLHSNEQKNESHVGR